MRSGIISTTRCSSWTTRSTTAVFSSANPRWCARCSIPHPLDTTAFDPDSYGRDAAPLTALLERAALNRTHRWEKMATGMGFFQKLRSSNSTKANLLQELAELAGRNHGLSERLQRHAAMCKFTNLKRGV